MKKRIETVYTYDEWVSELKERITKKLYKALGWVIVFLFVFGFISTLFIHFFAIGY